MGDQNRRRELTSRKHTDTATRRPEWRYPGTAATTLGRGGDVAYELRPDGAGLDHEQALHVLTTVLHDIFGARDPDEFTAEVF